MTQSTESPTPDPADEGALFVEEACRFAAVGRSRLYAMMRRREIVYFQLGTRRAVSKTSLKAWLRSRIGGQPATVPGGGTADSEGSAK